MILLVTGSSDRSADGVMRALDAMGARWARFDNDDLPLRARVVLRIPRAESSVLVTRDGRRIELAEVRAAWLWKGEPHDLPPGLPPGHRDLVDGACQDSLAGVLGWLEDRVLVVNPPRAFGPANDKVRQLRTAREAGLEVPETLVTNSPEAALEFLDRHEDAVFKLVNRTLWTCHDPELGRTLFTRRVGPLVLGP